MNMIEVSGLSKSFGTNRVLDGVSFVVPKGTVVGFLGANGAGKTTTMDILCGCIGADQGEVKIAGYDITDQDLEAKRRLGYLPDVPPLYGELTVQESVKFSAEINGLHSSKIKSRLSQVLERLSLGEVRGKLVGNLSKGFRQRVALAQALVHDPEVLILDEPTEGLDPHQILQMRELIKSLRGDHTVLLSSHILSEIQNVADSIIIINRGKVVTHGTYEDLTSKFEGKRAYKVRVGNSYENALAALRNLPEISELKLSDDRSISFNLSSANEVGLDRVAKAVVDGGFGLRELSQTSKSLEDVFYQLTR